MTTPGTPPVLGIIGGSGLYDLPGLEDKEWCTGVSVFGEPSDQLLFAQLAGQPVIFLPRHGRGHRIPPHAINYRANIEALKRAGVTEIVSVSAVGSLDAELGPGSFVLVDQFIDRTLSRAGSFFDTGLVAHVSMADPVCNRLCDHIEAAGKEAGISMRRGGVYLAMEGPQFSSRAESHLYRSWGCSVIGMTNMPEARLAREAEICYASVAMVTDYDCWHEGHEDVSVEAVIAVLLANADKGRSLISAVAPRLGDRTASCPAGCHTVLDTALVTDPSVRDPALVEKLDAIVGRTLSKQSGN